ncbi:MAG: hypothetical protein EOO15_07370 [Chitinophagaceae bacterium]|nr:MAG: hypothetical protein EOO15_07370 [Chitinophagaceae bacterium]
MKAILSIINQLFEIEKKTQGQPSVHRNLERIRAELQEMGYTWHNPLHEKYGPTRTDCEASITGELRDQMTITDVIKPIIHNQEAGSPRIVQKAIVVVA